MSQEPPRPKVPRADARHAEPAESDAQDQPDVGDADDAEVAHRTAKRGRRPRQSDTAVTYTVGYGRPPKHSQFKPLRSGNPKGRAPLTRTLKTMVKQVVEEPVELRVNGKVRRVTTLEFLLHRLMRQAANGDAKAWPSIFAILKHVGYGAEATEVSPEVPVSVDHRAVLKEFLDRLVLEEPTGDDPTAEDLPELDSPAKKEKP